MSHSVSISGAGPAGLAAALTVCKAGGRAVVSKCHGTCHQLGSVLRSVRLRRNRVGAARDRGARAVAQAGGRGAT